MSREENAQNYIRHERSLGLSEELIRSWWSKVKLTVSTQKHIFGHNPQIHRPITTTYTRCLFLSSVNAFTTYNI